MEISVLKPSKSEREVFLAGSGFSFYLSVGTTFEPFFNCNNSTINCDIIPLQ